MFIQFFKLSSRRRTKQTVQQKGKGFSLVEVLIALGLVGVLSAVVASLFVESSKNQRGLMAKSQQLDVKGQILALLSKPAACTNSFGGVLLTAATNHLQLRDELGTAVFPVGSNDSSGLLEFRNFNTADWVPDASDPTLGILSLRVSLQKTGSIAGPQVMAPILISLRVRAAPGNTLLSCRAIGSQADGFWLSSPMNPANIYYAGGRVGIGLGMDNPQTDLDVAGTIRITSPGVSIGGACANEGTFAYDSAAHRPVFCNQAGQWATFTAPPPTVVPASVGQVTSNPNVHTQNTLTCPSGHYVCQIRGMEQAGFGIIDFEVFCCPLP